MRGEGNSQGYRGFGSQGKRDIEPREGPRGERESITGCVWGQLSIWKVVSIQCKRGGLTKGRLTCNKDQKGGT